jgi:hypothetical protein
VLSGFSPATKTYALVVPLGTTLVDVTAGTDSVSNPNAVITINGTPGASLSGITVTAGSTTDITVAISADGKTTSNYTISVTVSAT